MFFSVRPRSGLAALLLLSTAACASWEKDIDPRLAQLAAQQPSVAEIDRRLGRRNRQTDGGLLNWTWEYEVPVSYPIYTYINGRQIITGYRHETMRSDCTLSARDRNGVAADLRAHGSIGTCRRMLDRLLGA